MNTSKTQTQTMGGTETLTDDTNFEILIDSRRESDYLEMLRKLKVDLADKNSECEVLKLKLDQNSKDMAGLTQDLNECRLTMFQNEQDARKAQEETLNSKKLESDYVQLMADYLDLSAECEQYKQNVYDNFITKSNAINNYECLMSSEVLSTELHDCRVSLNNKSAEMNLVLAKMRNQEEELNVKDKCITELRKSLDDAKVTHKHEIKVLEDYILCLKNTIESYEKTLTDMIDEPTPGNKVTEDNIEEDERTSQTSQDENNTGEAESETGF